MKTAILGAGVSGLSLARFLIEGGVPAEELHLFESQGEVGGLCRSKVVDGFTYDRAGGHILYSKDAAARDWMVSCAGGPDAFCETERKTRIRFGDRWVHYPFENGLGDLPPEVNQECITGYVAAWKARIIAGLQSKSCEQPSTSRMPLSISASERYLRDHGRGATQTHALGSGPRGRRGAGWAGAWGGLEGGSPVAVDVAAVEELAALLARLLVLVRRQLRTAREARLEGRLHYA